MSFQFNKGTVNVTGSVTSTVTKYTGTIITGTKVGVGNTTIGTVGAGKTWRIIGVHLESGLGASSAVVGLALNGIEVLSFNIQNTAATMNANPSSSLNFDYGACPVLTTGQTVVIVNTSSSNTVANCIYVEE